MTDTPVADTLATTQGHLRLWDSATLTLLWSNSTEPPESRRPLLDVLAERNGWTSATFDWPGRGRVWAGRVRLGDNGDVEARPEWDFIEGVVVAANPVFPETGSADE
ncbi:hypothetical protein [Mycobacterium aquaticum]|uniref:Uncharacterized protein n=1 Tax=Mycobacterium aquaticum TaxID=1927124 RepID=A0A1X0A4E1_9MYCO|nr:hypothetical protein [Mycobacterium aquaticum]ORA24920.1 hypothetical protein BST13_33665 [Mycobacterium aquaticum]